MQGRKYRLAQGLVLISAYISYIPAVYPGEALEPRVYIRYILSLSLAEPRRVTRHCLQPVAAAAENFTAGKEGTGACDEMHAF